MTSNHGSLIDRAKQIYDQYADLRQEYADKGGDWLRSIPQEDREVFDVGRRALDKLGRLIDKRGKRYAECRLDNYQSNTDGQRELISKLRQYCENMQEKIERGSGIILFGPRGTGKDHLLMAVARYAVSHFSHDVEWCNGLELYANLRNAISDDLSEEFIKRPLVKAPVLWLSDPCPPTGPLSEFQQAILFEIIDRRYNAMRPTWVTINVASRQEAEERIGAPTVDRMQDAALVHFCNWQSYRKAA